MDIQNELVWSHSRGRALHGCRRAYWFNYYGSWGGWDAAAPEEARQAYVQKKLTSRAMWTGTVVHGVAEQGLKRAMEDADRRLPTSDWPLEAMRRFARTRAEEDIAGSKSGRWLRRPSKLTGFAEHYYDLPVGEAEWAAALAEIDRQVTNLAENRIYKRLRVAASRIREVEELRRFPVGDAEVYLAVDALVGDGSGGVVIIDWKTGDNHDDAEIGAQLGIYGLYATQELGVPEDRIIAMHVNIRHGTETRHPVGPAEIEAARQAVATGIADMRGALVDVPNNIARKEDFPALAEGADRCRWCNFRRVCGRERA